jgi:hypothetical protein
VPVRCSRTTGSHTLPAMCTTLDPPTLTIASPDEETRNGAGGVVTLSRVRASARTLEASAVVGEFGGATWPSSETFIFGWNRSRASLGGVLAIPTHGAGAQLTVTVQILVEQVLYGGSVVLEPASSLLAPIQGDGSLPLRGGAVGWCNAGLSLYGATGSARTSLKFVSEWVNRDGADSVDRAPGGVFTLSNTVALGAETSSLSVFVDIEAFAGAEESDALQGAFTAFECRTRPVEEVNGIWLPPARLRLALVSATLCELPVLTRRPANTAD